MTNCLNQENKLLISGILQVQVQRLGQRWQQSALGHHGNQGDSLVTLRSVETVSSPFVSADNKKTRGVLSCLVFSDVWQVPGSRGCWSLCPGELRTGAAAQIDPKFFGSLCRGCLLPVLSAGAGWACVQAAWFLFLFFFSMCCFNLI